MTLPPLITRRSLQSSWGVSGETMRQLAAERKLPPYDVDISDRIRGWYPETLRAAGIRVPEFQAPAESAGSSQSA